VGESSRWGLRVSAARHLFGGVHQRPTAGCGCSIRFYPRAIRCGRTEAGSVAVRVLARALLTEIDMSFRTRSPLHGLRDIGYGYRLLS
jgi:hypothetical protein